MANIWTDNETKLLITIWRDQNIQQLENHSIRNKIVYEKLAKGMADGGFTRNAKQCQSKIKHLREKYRTYKDKIARSGAGAGKPPKFFNEIDEMLGTRPQTRPTFLLDSGNADADKESSSSSEFNPNQDDQNSSRSDGSKEESSADEDSNDDSLLDQSLNSINSTTRKCPKKRMTRHKPNKFESAVESFKEVLTGQHEENVTLTTSIQQQWLELEKQRIQHEKEEREQERQHEFRMMQLFSTMVNQGGMQAPQQYTSVPSTIQQNQCTYSDISHSSP
ncbi:Hypothetical predicted protein [Paramuricea clavata]|uniref:Myb/SANT-like DNA-binding domain-containing protein n=1 Tax=Paramuricea clavata TaxID=317549 RepID=A0A7D9DVI0_PARCT|nr:Hypothetical predicted protein [Paramuricea clavata]